MKVVTILVVLVHMWPFSGRAGAQAPPSCKEWRACRDLAQAAADREDYQAFVDLAWRAIQTGPPRDPALMYMLARAQALSGRAHDALVMLERLADMGVTTEAATDKAFAVTRELPGWAAFEARMAGLNGSGVPPVRNAPAPAAAPVTAAVPAPLPSPTPAASAAPAAASAAEALRLAIDPFTPAGLAYDAVSARFVVGDRLGRKLMVVSDGSTHATDLVRAESAGFNDIAALEIDARRGDLWVLSEAEGGTLHRLQLVSGRPLRSYRPAGVEPGRLADLAVTRAGDILVVDSQTRDLLVFHAGGSALERIVQLDAPQPVALAVAHEDTVAYVADGSGLSRVDLRTRKVSAVSAPKGVSLAGFERLRAYRNQLVAVRAADDGSREILQVELNRAGTSVTRVTRVHAVSGPGSERLAIAINGDDLVYLPGAQAYGTSGKAELVAYRLRLQAR